MVLLFSILSATGCGLWDTYDPLPDTYILSDSSGVVVYGKKYVPIDLGTIKTSIQAGKNAICIGEVRKEEDNKTKLFGIAVPMTQPVIYEVGIPLIYAGHSLSGYHCLESKYTECQEYIDNLVWTNKVVAEMMFTDLEYETKFGEAPPVKKDEFVFSEEFGAYVTNKLHAPASKFPANAITTLYLIYQTDSTGNFVKELGRIGITTSEDWYYFSELEYGDETTNQDLQNFEQYKLPENFAEEAVRCHAVKDTYSKTGKVN